MLTIHDLKVINIDKNRYSACRKLPPPEYTQKELTAQISAIGEAVLQDILNIDPKMFELQIEAARNFGVSYIFETPKNEIVGLSVATSLLKDNSNILRKNLIVPIETIRRSKQTRFLDKHYLIALFMKNNLQDGIIPEQEIKNVIIAGWVNLKTVNINANRSLPPSFTSKLSVAAIPCTQLNPIEEMFDSLGISNNV